MATGTQGTDTHRQITHTHKINKQFQQRNNGKIKVCVYRAHSFSPNHSDKASWTCGRETCIDREISAYKLSHGEIFSTGVDKFKAATCFMGPPKGPNGENRDLDGCSHVSWREMVGSAGVERRPSGAGQ